MVDTRRARRLCDCRRRCVQHMLRLVKSEVTTEAVTVPGIRFLQLPGLTSIRSSSTEDRSALGEELHRHPGKLLIGCGCRSCTAHWELVQAGRTSYHSSPWNNGRGNNFFPRRPEDVAVDLAATNTQLLLPGRTWNIVKLLARWRCAPHATRRLLPIFSLFRLLTVPLLDIVVDLFVAFNCCFIVTIDFYTGDDMLHLCISHHGRGRTP